MRNRAKITFIIVTWNNEKQIRDCIQTIKRYIRVSYKIVIVDNKSFDRTVKIIKNEFSNIILIESKENLGFARANNLALQEVTSEYVCFLNPDVILTEDIISPSIKILEDRKDIGVVSCKLLNFDHSRQNSCFNFATPWARFCEILHVGKVIPNFICKKYFPNYYNEAEDFYPDWVIGAEMILRTSDAKFIKGFSTEYYMYTEDMDLCKKINVYLKKKVLFLSTYSLIHLGGASEAQNISYDKQKKLFENEVIFSQKFYGYKTAKDLVKYMILAYQIRLTLLKLAYRFSDRRYQIEKTRKAIEMIREINK